MIETFKTLIFIIVFLDILKTVVYDGKAQRILKPEGVFYKAVDTLLPIEGNEIQKLFHIFKHVTTKTTFFIGLVQSPCGICGVFDFCNDSTGAITPRLCTYMKEWLE